MGEVVAGFIVRLVLSVESVTYRAEWLPESHEIDDKSGRADEENLHQSVIQRDVIHEEIDVTHAKDDQVKLLRLTREACDVNYEPLTDAVARLVNPVHE